MSISARAAWWRHRRRSATFCRMARSIRPPSPISRCCAKRRVGPSSMSPAPMASMSSASAPRWSRPCPRVRRRICMWVNPRPETLATPGRDRGRPGARSFRLFDQRRPAIRPRRRLCLRPLLRAAAAARSLRHPPRRPRHRPARDRSAGAARHPARRFRFRLLPHAPPRTVLGVPMRHPGLSADGRLPNLSGGAGALLPAAAAAAAAIGLAGRPGGALFGHPSFQDGAAGLPVSHVERDAGPDHGRPGRGPSRPTRTSTPCAIRRPTPSTECHQGDPRHER